MTDIIVRNLSLARKPRSLRECTECNEPTYPGLPRYRAQFWREGHEQEGHFHVTCIVKWFTKVIRDNRETLPKPGKK